MGRSEIAPDLKAVLLTKPHRVLFTDGCCWRTKGGELKAGWAVVEARDRQWLEVSAGTIERGHSAQMAEVVAIVKALELCLYIRT